MVESTGSQQVRENVCPVDEAVRTFDEVLLGYDRASAVAEARRGQGLSFASASAGCPFGVDLGALVQTLATADFDGAARGVRQAHPWGSILGRCCHRFCEQADAADYPEGMEPLNLRGLERAAADWGRHEPPTLQVPQSGKRVAVAGAGARQECGGAGSGKYVLTGDVAGDVGNDGAFMGGRVAAASMCRYLADPTRSWPEIPQDLRIEAQRPGVELARD